MSIQWKDTVFVGTAAIAVALVSGAMLPRADAALPVVPALQTAVHVPDAVVQPERLHKSANLSYKVAGKRYYPRKTITAFSQEGRASWYGPGFHGRKTSSGEKYDKHLMTAAHPTLPIPSYARVTNLSNGRQIIVRINDRGPFHSKRIIDLSQAAASKLGFLRAGTTQVRVEQILPKKKIKHIYTELRSFDNLADAQAYLNLTARRLNGKGSPQGTSELIRRDGRYIVRLASTLENADQTVLPQDLTALLS